MYERVETETETEAETEGGVCGRVKRRQGLVNTSWVNKFKRTINREGKC